MSQEKKTGYPSIDKTHLKGFSKMELNPKIVPLSIYATFVAINSNRMSETAVIDRGYSYSKLAVKNDSIYLMRALRLYGMRRGDKIAIITPNIYEGIVMTIASNALGIAVVYLNPLDDIGSILTAVGKHKPNALFVTDRDEKFMKIINVCTKAPVRLIINYNLSNTKEPIYQFSSSDDSERGFFGKKRENKDILLSQVDFVSYEAFLFTGIHDDSRVYLPIIKNMLCEDELLYLQTSGSSSGKPKGLPFTNENIFASLVYASNSTGTKTNDGRVNRVLCILPYRLPYGWMTMFVNLMGGNTVVLAPGASPEDIGNYYFYKPSYVYGTPVILRAFMDNTPKDADLSFLEAFFVAGFSITEAQYKECREFLDRHNASHAEIRNNYGIGEGLCIGTASDGMPHFDNTVGKFYVGPEWVIVDDDMHEVKYGEIGEALVSSKSLCKGYFGEPELTAKAFIKYRGKTFYRTGDYMSLSEDGIVTFYGRKKRFYQPLGATDKVNCETIEDAIMDSGFAKMCAVVVVPDEEKVQTSKAFVVLKDEYRDYYPAVDDIRLSIKKELADFQLPRDIEILDEIPLMKSGKINYTKLETM